MTAKTDCLATLRRLIERAERGELAEAQAAIIQYALASPDLPRRAQDMAELQQELAAEMASATLTPIQEAYHAVVEAMIDRTRDAVLGNPT